ncbi:DUF192 domain-containing protein [soil metagenome]
MKRQASVRTPAGWLYVRIADGFVDRAVGLLGRRSLDEAHGLLLHPCSSIHTAFMRMPIDVLFLDEQSRVLSVATLRPWRVRWVPKAVGVVELAAGVAARHGVTRGVRLDVLRLPAAQL